MYMQVYVRTYIWKQVMVNKKHLWYKKVIWPRITAETKKEWYKSVDKVTYIIEMHLRWKGDAN